jgi:DNA-binding NarL/FixJ family response regulator
VTAAPGSADPARALRVLVVDDDPRVRAGLAGMLTATPGLAVASATGSARRALAVAGRGFADVALVDVLMPTVADGVELVGRLSEHVPVVAISLDGTNRVQVLAAGAVAYVEKDGAVEDLLAALLAAAESTSTSSTSQ